MSSITQTESGKAWEYGLARKCADMFCIPLIENSPKNKAQNSYNLFPSSEQRKIYKAADSAVNFLNSHDKRLNNAKSVTLQSDMSGCLGDVRDILIETNTNEVGISAKHRHGALKHSRLSGQNDFGNEWYGVPCSESYWQDIKPIFAQLQKQNGGKWKDLPDKFNAFYIPVLQAFINEVKKYAVPKEMMKYLLGKYDFYKIIKENGNVSIVSFNIYNTLKWGRRLNLPDRIIEVAFKPKSKTTVSMILDQGWQLSFRIHNARSIIEPSLKFDINLVGCPNQLTTHSIPYD